jgi:hypothetical protein
MNQTRSKHGTYKNKARNKTPQEHEKITHKT